jgi:hypothetical protein
VTTNMVMVQRQRCQPTLANLAPLNYNNYDPTSSNNDAYTKLGFNDGGNQLWQWHSQVMTMTPTNVCNNGWGKLGYGDGNENPMGEGGH